MQGQPDLQALGTQLRQQAEISSTSKKFLAACTFSMALVHAWLALQQALSPWQAVRSPYFCKQQALKRTAHTA